MAPKSILARHKAARMMASKALIAKAVAARTEAAKALASKMLAQKTHTPVETSSSKDSTSDANVSSTTFQEFEKLLNDTFNPNTKKSSHQEMNIIENQSSIDDPNVEDHFEISFLPSLNDECTVEAAMYPFKLVLTPQEQRRLETSISSSNINM